jgi:hypothetical protein
VCIQPAGKCTQSSKVQAGKDVPGYCLSAATSCQISHLWCGQAGVDSCGVAQVPCHATAPFYSSILEPCRCRVLIGGAVSISNPFSSCTGNMAVSATRVSDILVRPRRVFGLAKVLVTVMTMAVQYLPTTSVLKPNV